MKSFSNPLKYGYFLRNKMLSMGSRHIAAFYPNTCVKKRIPGVSESELLK